MTRSPSMTRVYGKRGNQGSRNKPASGSEPTEAQTTEEDEEASERPMRVVRMPYLAFLDPAKQKVK